MKEIFLSPIKVMALIFVIFLAVVGITIFILEEQTTVWTNDAFIEGYGMDLSTNVTEEIIALFVDEGDIVQKGQIIAQLQNNVPLSKKEASEAKIKSLTEEISVQEARFRKIRNDFIRALIGFEDKVVSEQNFDHAEKNLEIIIAEIKLAKANLELAKKQLEVINAELTHYTILAPQDGVIAKRWVWLGDVTTPGQSLFTMYDLKNVWVLANLEEGKIENIKLGDPVEIHVDAYPNYTFHGNIFTIKGAAASQFTLIPQNTATGNFTKVSQRIPIKITIEPPKDFPKNQPLYLFPGMSAEVRISVKQMQNLEA